VALAAAFTLMLLVAGIARAAAPTYVERGGFETYLQHPSRWAGSRDSPQIRSPEFPTRGWA
jgi:hypothetical protein